MDGILALWKEKGMTSHDCVFKLRKILKTKKIGHGGTLDPDVDGVLPICIGKGTKVIEYLVDGGKEYTGEITLGFSTTTEDKTGKIVEVKAVEKMLEKTIIDKRMQEFVGMITQIPPMYSAVKVNGKRLYEYARAGLVVERPMRTANIASFERTSDPIFDKERGTLSWRFKVACGKGTYIRTLAVDLGEKLGYPAHMSDLTRIKAGGMAKEDSLTLAQVQEKMENDTIKEVLKPIELGVVEFPRIDLTEEQYKKVKNGMRLTNEELGVEDAIESLVALFYHQKVVSLYQKHPIKENVWKPTKVLRNSL